MLVGGAWRASADAMDVRDPEDNSLVAFVPRATAEDAREAVAHAAGRGTAAARTLPAHWRAAILRGAADRVEAEAEEYARLIASEGIKTIREARREVARAVGTLRLCAGEAERLVGETVPFAAAGPGGEGRHGWWTR